MWELLLAAPFVDVERMLRLRSVLFGKKSLQRADRDRLVDLPAATSRLARMGADSSTDAGQRIRIARQPVSFFKSVFGDQTHVASGICMSRAGHHAGKVGVQPVCIDLLAFESLQHGHRTEMRIPSACNHWGAVPQARPLPFTATTGPYLVKVKSALAPPDTATGFDWFFAPSCH